MLMLGFMKTLLDDLILEARGMPPVFSDVVVTFRIIS